MCVWIKGDLIYTLDPISQDISLTTPKRELVKDDITGHRWLTGQVENKH